MSCAEALDPRGVLRPRKVRPGELASAALLLRGLRCAGRASMVS
jgi:hypothetical protein